MTNGITIWLTGFSGSGKTTIANHLKERLDSTNINSCVLDGDVVRDGLCSGLGFSKDDRVENNRRIANVAKILNTNGIIAIVASISPYRIGREIARDIIGTDRFIEIHVATPISVCEERDPKGLYKKVRSGEISNFTGINDIYEPPTGSEMWIDTSLAAIDLDVDSIISKLRKYGY